MARLNPPARFVPCLLALSLFTQGVGIAVPALPSASIAPTVVQLALRMSETKAQGNTPPTFNLARAAMRRADGIRQASADAQPRRLGSKTAVHGTAYNSTPGQTDATPFITATGSHVRPGVVALSRDLLGRFPYGTRLHIEDLSGTYSAFLKNRTFIVEDTMNVRLHNTLDIWMGSTSEAIQWGVRTLQISALR